MVCFRGGVFIRVLRETSRVVTRVVIIVPSKLSLFRLFDPLNDSPERRLFSHRLFDSLLLEILVNIRMRFMAETGFLSIVGEGISCTK